MSSTVLENRAAGASGSSADTEPSIGGGGERSQQLPEEEEEDQQKEVEKYVKPGRRKDSSFLAALCTTQITRVLILVAVVLVIAIISTVCYFSIPKLHRGRRRPNILLLIADDLGWGDVGWHSSDIKTPNLTRLAREGVILSQFYSQPICTASRAALFSGRYPFKLGLQGSRPILAGVSNSSLPLDNTLLPQLLQREGYQTHMVGKWHLGFETTAHTPVARGFHTFTGFYNGMQDYFTHQTTEYDSVEDVTGYDMREDYLDAKGRPVVDNILWSKNGTFNNIIFTDRAVSIIETHQAEYDEEAPLFLVMSYANPHTPIQVPPEYEDMSDSENEARRKYAGLVLAMDSSVGRITAALNETGLLENTIVLFVSDNGGSMTYLNGGSVLPTGSSNFPLRGEKGGLWEAACRVPAFLWGPGVIPQGKVLREPVHITDLYPTIAALADTSLSEDLQPMDGYDLSKTIQGKDEKSREYFIYDLDPVYKQIAIRLLNWKLILGTASISQVNGRYPPLVKVNDTVSLGEDAISGQPFVALARSLVGEFRNQSSLCDSVQCIYGDDMEVQLFDLDTDEYEFRNVEEEHPGMVEAMIEILNTEIRDMVQPVNLLEPGEPAASPKNFNGTWMPWLDNR